MLAVAPHVGPWREMVLDLKYHSRVRLARNMALTVVQFLNEQSVTASAFNAVSWIPTTDVRRRQRGFDHAEIIARHVGAQLQCTARQLLRRTSNSHQSGATRRQRLMNPTYVAHPRCGGERVLLIDDVTTTGATFREAARALLRSGAAGVVCCAVTFVPDLAVRSRPELAPLS